MTIRDAKAEDMPQIARIYSYYVENTAISFEIKAPDWKEMEARRESFIPYPYIVAEEDGRIMGYAYAHPFSEREAYRRSAEVTIYIDKDNARKGIGTMLYGKLEERLMAMDIHNLYAVVMYPGLGSVGFHERMGYRIAGKLTDCGEKFGKLWSVVYMEKLI